MLCMYKRISMLVESNNLSGKEFGLLLGLKKSPLTDWKNGKSKPTLDQIIKICDLFAISSDWLLFGENDVKKEKSKYETVFEMFEQLSEEDKHDISVYIKTRHTISKQKSLQLEDEQNDN